MKITEKELIEELESIRDNAQRFLERNHSLMLPQNNAGTGMLIAERDLCDRLLGYIKNGFEDD